MCCTVKVKVKISRYKPGVAQRVGRGIALLFHDRGTRRGEWSAARPGRTLPPGKTRYPFYRRLGGPQGRSGRAENLVPTGDSIPNRPARSSFTIPTELPGPHIALYCILPQKYLKVTGVIAPQAKCKIIRPACQVAHN